MDPVPAGPKRVHGFLKSQSDWRQRKSRDLLAGLVLQLPQASRLSLGLFQTLVLAGRGGVWQVSAWRSRAAAGPLRGGVGQVGTHQLQDLFHLREGGRQRATGPTGLTSFDFPSSRGAPGFQLPLPGRFLQALVLATFSSSQPSPAPFHSGCQAFSFLICQHTKC